MNAEDYRRWALKCLVMARRAADPQRKAKLIDMAASWSLLANEGTRDEPFVQQQQHLQPMQSSARES
jgi:hypothetical protein